MRRFAFLLLLLTGTWAGFGPAPTASGQKPLTRPQMKAFFKKACRYWGLKYRGASEEKLNEILEDVAQYDAFSWKGLRPEFLKPFIGPKPKEQKKPTIVMRYTAADIMEESYKNITPGETEECHYILQGKKGRKPRPLVIALHGGSRGVGSPGQAMSLLGNTYLGKKCVVAAPKVPSKAVFAQPISAKFVREIIWEVGMQYPIDWDRLYCTGHSLGGVGSWYMPSVMPDVFAASSPAAGNPPAIVDYEYLYNTPIYVVHGATDIQVTPDADRRAAEMIKNIPAENKREGYFFYREIVTHDRRGHALPSEVVRDMAAFVLKFTRNYVPERVICVCPFTRARGQEIHPNARCFWLQIEGSAWGSKADGRIEKDNTVRITLTGAGKLIVYLSDDMVDMNEPVKIWVNNKLRVNRVIPRSARFMLEHIEQTRDRGRTFANQVVVAGEL